MDKVLEGWVRPKRNSTNLAAEAARAKRRPLGDVTNVYQAGKTLGGKVTKPKHATRLQPQTFDTSLAKVTRPLRRVPVGPVAADAQRHLSDFVQCYKTGRYIINRTSEPGEWVVQRVFSVGRHVVGATVGPGARDVLLANPTDMVVRVGDTLHLDKRVDAGVHMYTSWRVHRDNSDPRPTLALARTGE